VWDSWSDAFQFFFFLLFLLSCGLVNYSIILYNDNLIMYEYCTYVHTHLFTLPDWGNGKARSQCIEIKRDIAVFDSRLVVVRLSRRAITNCEKKIWIGFTVQNWITFPFEISYSTASFSIYSLLKLKANRSLTKPFAIKTLCIIKIFSRGKDLLSF